MNQPKLSKRLLCAAEFVRDGAKAADVGCDHGKLAAFLITSGKAKSVVATDINQMPLSKAQQLFEKLNIESKATAVRCFGLDNVLPIQADDIVIAGIGSDTISEIITNTDWLKSSEKRLILVPASHHERLRSFLYLSGYKIEDESAIVEAGHCYTVIAASYCEAISQVSAPFASLGKIKNVSDDALAYILKERQKAERMLAVNAGADKLQAASEIIKYIDEELL